MKRASILAALVIELFVLGGCTNPPGGLELTLRPIKQIFEPDEPVRLDAVFSAHGGAVCIEKPSPLSMKVDISCIGSDEQFSAANLVFCGTPYVLLLPLFPVMMAAELVDVADVGGRYLIVPDGKLRSWPFQLVRNGTTVLAMSARQTSRERDSAARTQWPAGRYRVRIALRNPSRSNPPPPLFWTVYSQTVEADAEFSVAEPMPEAGTAPVGHITPAG